MYKYLIVGVTFLILGYAAYYFNTSGGSTLLTKAFSQDIESRGGVSIAQLFSGEYRCDASDGCENPTTIILLDDTTFELFYIETETDEQIFFAQGTWGVAKNNKLILMVDKQFSVASSPGVIYGTIDTIKIKDFSKKKPLFAWMQNPIFTVTKSQTAEKKDEQEEEL